MTEIVRDDVEAQLPEAGIRRLKYRPIPFLIIWTSVSTILLIASTYRLWFPTSYEFPLVPMHSALVHWPLVVDWISTFGCLLGLIGLTTTAFTDRARWTLLCSGIVIVFAVLLCSLNQHRLQPWFYQLLLFCFVFPIADSDRKLRLLRWLVISVYVYSALGKFDYQFIHTVGLTMFVETFKAIGWDLSGEPIEGLASYVLLLPAMELFVAMLLCFPTTRRLGGIAASIFHIVLLLIFAVVLKHSGGVILWNLQFAGQAVLLFALRDPSDPSNSDNPRKSSMVDFYEKYIATAIVYAAMIMPLFERVGLWDHWPSWALYAPHSSRVAIQIPLGYKSELPESLRQCITDSNVNEYGILIPISRWSLQTLRTPVYPQARFQLSIARRLAESIDNRYAIEVEVQEIASRFRGIRKRQTLRGLDAIESYSRRYIFNTEPRKPVASSKTGEELE